MARTVLLIHLAWPVIVWIERWLRGLKDSRRPIAFTVLLAPFLFPELLIGYAYRDVALASPRLAEWLCAGLLFVRIVPIGVIALLASPPSLISAEAIHCRWMLVRANAGALHRWWPLLACWWQGPIRRALPALGLMSVVSFQEFETAALLQTASWTDWFITARRVGLDPQEMRHQAIWPVVMQLPLLAGAIFWLSPRAQPETERREPDGVFISVSSSYAVIAYLCLAIAFGCLIPLGTMARFLPGGLRLLFRQQSQWSGLGLDILIASAVSLCAGLTAWFVAGSLLRISRYRWFVAALRMSVVLPGLIGSLLLSLVTAELFQLAWLRPLYDTPLPWVLSLIVWLMPRAMLLHLWLEIMTRSEAIHLAEMLTGRVSSRNPQIPSKVNRPQFSPPISNETTRLARLLFRLRDHPRLLAMGLVCYWAYLDLSTAYLLAPSGMASGLVRLYNFMHFGRSASLSAESLLFFGIPLVTTITLIQLLRLKS